MPLMELNVEGLWARRQSAQGTPATAPSTAGTGKRYRKVAGDVGVAAEDGSENYSDGSRLSSVASFRQSLQGGGSPGLQYQPGAVGHLSFLWCGQETVSGTATNNVQTLTVSGTPASGSAILTFSGQATVAIAFNATAAAVQAALEALGNIGTGNVTCAGGPWPGTPITVTFVSQMAASPQVLLTATDTFNTGDVIPSQTTAGVAVEHTATPGSTGAWASFWKLLGASVVQRQRFNDCRVSGLQFQCGRDQFVGRITPTVISLDPGEVVATDPTLADDVDQSMVWTEGEGEFKINGTVFSGITGYNIQPSDNLTPAYGDSVRPFDVGTGVGGVQGSDINLYLNAAGLAKYNEFVYGATAPVAGTKPISRVPAIGSFRVRHWRFNTTGNPGRLIDINCPNVQWITPDAPGGNPDGGLATITLGFNTVKVGATPHITIITRSADGTYASE